MKLITRLNHAEFFKGTNSIQEVIEKISLIVNQLMH